MRTGWIQLGVVFVCVLLASTSCRQGFSLPHDGGADVPSNDGDGFDGDDSDEGVSDGDGSACQPETDAELCTTAGAACGELPTVDRCGTDRTPDCGTCTLPQTCGGGGIPNQCGSPLSQTLAVAVDEDDGEIDGCSNLLNIQGEHDQQLYVGSWCNAWTWSYFRFALSADLPAGVSIVAARLGFYCKGEESDSWDGTLHTLHVAAQDEASATQVSQGNDRPDYPSGFPLTTSSVTWATPVDWPTEAWIDSPDLSCLVQELVDRHNGLAAGDSIQFWVRLGGAVFYEAEVSVQDSSHASGNGATLTIDWTP